MAKECRNCSKTLTGKQRKWCSDLCRKQVSRRVERGQKAVRKLSANLSANQGAFAPGRIVEMRIVVDSDQLHPYLQSRNALLLQIQHVLMSKAVKMAILEQLEDKIPGYAFQVVVLYPW